MMERALQFANEKHHGQTRTGGAPFITHPVRVASHFEGDDFLMSCALLHDTVEDTNATLVEIDHYFGESIARTVDALTHRIDETYAQYIQRVLADACAIKVKIADILDNVLDHPTTRMKERASYALPKLLEQL